MEIQFLTESNPQKEKTAKHTKKRTQMMRKTRKKRRIRTKAMTVTKTRNKKSDR